MKHFKQCEYLESSKTVRCGVGLSLEEMDEYLIKMGGFLPHGQCTTVAVGGHVQSGGLSAYFMRALGLFHDYAQQFRIVTADAQVRTIVRPKSAKILNDNDELWYAVMGGMVLLRLTPTNS